MANWHADVYYKRTEWIWLAIYDDFRRRYPRHEKVDYATYQIGMTLYKKAPKIYEEIRSGQLRLFKAGKGLKNASQIQNTWKKF